MKPDARKHNPDPQYLRTMIESIGLSQRECARIIGINERQMRMYLASTGRREPAPYPVQYALEMLLLTSAKHTETSIDDHDQPYK